MKEIRGIAKRHKILYTRVTEANHKFIRNRAKEKKISESALVDLLLSIARERTNHARRQKHLPLYR